MLDSYVVDAKSLISLYPREASTSVYVQVWVKHGSVIGSLCVLVYDYLCTLDQEIDYVWSRRRSLGAYLFLLNRYLPFMDLILSVYAIKVELSPEGCLRQYSLITWCNTAGIFLCYIILALRTIAIWEKNGWILLIIGVLIPAAMASSIVSAKLYLNSLLFVPSTLPIYLGCILHKNNSMIIYSFISVFVVETTIVVLTLIRTVTHLRRSTSSWVHHLYQRGFIFYLYILALTTLNMLFPIFAPHSIKTTFTDPQRAFHSIFATRVLLNILSLQREQDEREISRSDSRLRSTETDNGIILSTVLDTFNTRHYDPDLDEG